jgi:uncharacterized surface protein with fasciclin (FAS1) repeats
MSITKTPRLVAVVSLAAVSAVAVGACSSSSKASDTANPTTSAPATTPAAAETSTTQTIVDVASANPEFSTLVSAVKAAGLAETLSGAGPFTVFAPTNAAFDKLPAGTVDSLLKPENKQKLADILTYHVVSGKVMADEVTAGTVKTVNGADVTAAVNGGKVTITDGQGNTAKVVQADVPASNGVIHVIDTVLLPPAS